MKFVLRESVNDPVIEAIASITKTLNSWKNSSEDLKNQTREDCKQGKYLNDNENKLKALLDAVKNSSETDRDYYIDNLKALYEYENLLFEDLYNNNNDAKTKLQNYISQIDNVVQNKINNVPPSTTPQPTTTPVPAATGSPTPTRDLSEKLTPEDNAKLIKKLEEMGFEL